MLSALGAIVFGLGVILFFAYNWSEMGKATKLVVLFGGLVASHGTGFWLVHSRRSSAPPSRAAVESLHLLGTMLFGAGIWLVSQIYHFDNPYPGALVVWALGALAMAWALPSPPQAVVALALLVGRVWEGAFDGAGPEHAQADFLSFGLVVVGILPLAFLCRSRMLHFFGAVALFFVLPLAMMPAVEEVWVFAAFFVAAAYWGLGEWGELRGRTDLAGGSIPGRLVYLGFLLALTFEPVVVELARNAPESAVQKLFFFVPLALALGTLAAAAAAHWARKPGSVRGFPETGSLRRASAGTWGLAAAAIAVVAYAVLPFPALPIPFARDPFLWARLFDLLLVVHGVVLVLQGSRTQSWRRVTAGSLLLAALATARFVDLFESLLARSLAFLLVGIGLYAIGAYYKRHETASETRHA